jgi:uncharacterized protein (TIGR02453 family)
MLAGGRKQERGRAGYYIRISPGDSFLAGGAHQPPGPWMAEIRKCIETDGDRLRAILAARAFKSCFGAMEGEKLKTAPRGYAKDHPELELLRHKSFLAVHKLTDGKVTGPGLLTHAAKMFAALKPFDDFLNGVTG